MKLPRLLRNTATLLILLPVLAAQAATPDLVPDLGPILSAPNDDQPDPAPTAPPVESSYEAFDSDQPIQQLRIRQLQQRTIAQREIGQSDR